MGESSSCYMPLLRAATMMLYKFSSLLVGPYQTSCIHVTLSLMGLSNGPDLSKFPCVQGLWNPPTLTWLDHVAGFSELNNRTYSLP